MEQSLSDAAFDENINFFIRDGKSVVTACVGKMESDTDDVRCYTEAAAKALRRYLQSGHKRPHFINFATAMGRSFDSENDYGRINEAILLSLLHEAYVPLECREDPHWHGHRLQEIFIDHSFLTESQLDWVLAVDQGRTLAKDIIEPDPERMTPLRIAEHVQSYFTNQPNVRITVEKEDLVESYPLLAAVARASMHVPRHHPVVLHLEYSHHSTEEDLYFVGKGISYDTGKNTPF